MNNSSAVEQLKMILDNGHTEGPVQEFMSTHPFILLQCFTQDWEVRACFPKFALGNQYQTDFLLVSGQSFQYTVTLIELEPPLARLYTTKGVAAERLNQAQQQVAEWDAWIQQNPDFFRAELGRRLRSEGKHDSALKYGAQQIEPSAPLERHSGRFGLKVTYKILIGRRQMMSFLDNVRRATQSRLSHDQIEIVTYDRLLDVCTRIDKDRS